MSFPCCYTVRRYTRTRVFYCQVVSAVIYLGVIHELEFFVVWQCCCYTFRRYTCTGVFYCQAVFLLYIQVFHTSLPGDINCFLEGFLCFPMFFSILLHNLTLYMYLSVLLLSSFSVINLDVIHVSDCRGPCIRRQWTAYPTVVSHLFLRGIIGGAS